MALSSKRRRNSLEPQPPILDFEGNPWEESRDEELALNSLMMSKVRDPEGCFHRDRTISAKILSKLIPMSATRNPMQGQLVEEVFGEFSAKVDSDDEWPKPDAQGSTFRYR